MDEGLLTHVERSRAAAFLALQDRQDFIAAHLLVRMCAGQLLGIDPGRLEVVQRCAGCRREGHGKPSLAGLPDMHISFSHTRCVVAAAAGWDLVGIDIESQTRSSVQPDVMRQVLTSSELRILERHPYPTTALLRHWVRKEALIKVGRATLDTLHQLDLSSLLSDEPTTPLWRTQFDGLHLLEWADDRHGVVCAVAGTHSPRLGVAAMPLSDVST
ncbi:4'-phosphopantetheinyl transferase family protein [Streptomyces chartreusis]|uniref:4'-phosphopantetheinyl transferase family protein n=1 Tax=Streptomyces chartreusis TaxID=1969 RepID=UPI00380F5EA9